MLTLHAPALEFVPVVAGGFALGFWEAAAFVLLAIAFLLSKVPLPGFAAAAGYIQGRAHDMQSWAQDRVSGMMGTLNRIMHQSYAASHNYASLNTDASDAYLRAALNVQQRVIPNRAQTAQAHTDAARAQAISHSDALHRIAIAHTDAVGAQDAAYARALHAAAVQLAQQLDLGERQLSAQLHAQAIAFTQAIGQADQKLSLQLQAQAIAFTQEAVVEAERYAGRVGADAQAYTDAVAKTLESYVERVGANAAQDTRAVVSSAVVPLAGALALTDEAVNVLRNSECMKFCNVLGGIGSLLQGLELAGLLALLAEAYSNPQGAADVVRQDLAQPAESALSDVLGLFGVRAG